MTPQEVFDTVVDHLRQQGSKSLKLDEQGQPVRSDFSSKPMCMYRAPDGKKCAIGCLILDEEYKPSVEDYDVEYAMAHLPDFGNRLHQVSHILPSLQTIHDDAEVEEWEEAFEKLARVFDLQYTPPTPKA